MHSGTKTGLCLCGGGITGAMYQVGCLAALEDGIPAFRANAFDVYVGTASGATVATGLAGELSVQRIYRALLNPSDDFFPLQRNHLLHVDFPELKRVFGSALLAVRRTVSAAATSPLDLKVWNELERFVDSFPAGFFSLEPYERFLVDFMVRRGIPNSFEQMPRKLLVVANDLDAGRRVVFGEGELIDVPVAKAVAASSAIPIMFAPVRVRDRDYVDGGIGDVAHIDVAEQMGCKLILVINPMVPVRAGSAGNDVPTGHGRRRRVRDKGLVWVYNQSMRLRMEARLRLGLERFRKQHPDTEVMLLEPDQSDATLFMHSPMNFAARRAILEDGYTSTTRLLRDESSTLSQTLRHHGFRPSAPPGTAG